MLVKLPIQNSVKIGHCVRYIIQCTGSIHEFIGIKLRHNNYYYHYYH